MYQAGSPGFLGQAVVHRPLGQWQGEGNVPEFHSRATALGFVPLDLASLPAAFDLA